MTELSELSLSLEIACISAEEAALTRSGEVVKAGSHFRTGSHPRALVSKLPVHSASLQWRYTVTQYPRTGDKEIGVL